MRCRLVLLFLCDGLWRVALIRGHRSDDLVTWDATASRVLNETFVTYGSLARFISDVDPFDLGTAWGSSWGTGGTGLSPNDIMPCEGERCPGPCDCGWASWGDGCRNADYSQCWYPCCVPMLSLGCDCNWTAVKGSCERHDGSPCWARCCGVHDDLKPQEGTTYSLNNIPKTATIDCNCAWTNGGAACGDDDGTICWSHCCGSDCDCGWAANKSACHHNDGSTCWDNCCMPVLIKELGELNLNLGSTTSNRRRNGSGANQTAGQKPTYYGPGIQYCFASDVPWQVRALTREVTANISRLVPCMQFQELEPSRFDSNSGDGQGSWCGEKHEAPVIVLLTPRCDSSAPRGCVCDQRLQTVVDQRFLLLRLAAPSCQRAGVITHELVNAAAASRGTTTTGGGATRVGRRLTAEDDFGLPSDVWEKEPDANKLWAQAVLATSDVTQLEQAHMVIPMHGARCFDIPEQGADVCVGTVSRVCERSSRSALHCCSCGGGLRVGCSSGQASLSDGRSMSSSAFRTDDVDPVVGTMAANMVLFDLALRPKSPLWIVPLAVVVASYLVWTAVSLATHRFHASNSMYTTASSCMSDVVLWKMEQDERPSLQLEHHVDRPHEGVQEPPRLDVRRPRPWPWSSPPVENRLLSLRFQLHHGPRSWPWSVESRSPRSLHGMARTTIRPV
jgi:hypothetical protein